jgi:hypothetical protein
MLEIPDQVRDDEQKDASSLIRGGARRAEEFVKEIPLPPVRHAETKSKKGGIKISFLF